MPISDRNQEKVRHFVLLEYTVRGHYFEGHSESQAPLLCRLSFFNEHFGEAMITILRSE